MNLKDKEVFEDIKQQADSTEGQDAMSAVFSMWDSRQHMTDLIGITTRLEIKCNNLEILLDGYMKESARKIKEGEEG